MRIWVTAAAVLATAAMGGCATTGGAAQAAPKPKAEAKAAPKPLPKGLDPQASANPFPSTYKPLAGRPGVTGARGPAVPA